MATDLQFVQVPNDFFLGRGSDKGVSPLGIRLYCMLEEYRLFYAQKVITSIDVLSSLMRVRKRSDRNKEAIRNALLELKDKGYISIEHSGDELKNHSTMSIGKEPFEHGFTKVNVSYYRDLTDVDEFALMCVMLKNKSQKRLQISADELAYCIQCERKKAMTVADRLKAKELIAIVGNGFYKTTDGQVRKEKNTFRVRSDYQAAKRDEVKNTVQQKSKVESTQEHLDEPEKRRETAFDRGHWDDENSYLDYDDYRILQKFGHRDPEWAERCYIRLNGLRRKKPKTVSQWESDYEREVRNEKEQQKAMDRQLATMAQEEYEGEQRRVNAATRYKKERYNDDISDILEDEDCRSKDDEWDELFA